MAWLDRRSDCADSGHDVFGIEAEKAQTSGEGYGGFDSENTAALESSEFTAEPDKSPVQHALAFVPLILVGAVNKCFTIYLPKWYPNGFDFSSIGLKEFGKLDISSAAAIWSVELALVIGIITTILFDWRRVLAQMKDGLNEGIGGALLASMNTGVEYGFGGVIAALPGFHKLSSGISHTFTDPLVNGAVTTTALAGITGSASGGMGIALSAMSDQYLQAIHAYNIPPEVMHRIISMASGGMDTLPHNGAVITLLAVTGLTHRQSYRDIFAITLIKTAAVFAVIAIYSLTGLV